VGAGGVPGGSDQLAEADLSYRSRIRTYGFLAAAVVALLAIGFAVPYVFGS
jgi:hypothetical protein